MDSIERRLETLEAKVATNQRGTYAGLVALCEAGVLQIEHLTDTELWWIIVGKAEPMPDDAEVDRRLADAVERK